MLPSFAQQSSMHSFYSDEMILSGHEIVLQWSMMLGAERKSLRRMTFLLIPGFLKTYTFNLFLSFALLHIHISPDVFLLIFALYTYLMEYLVKTVGFHFSEPGRNSRNGFFSSMLLKF